MKENYYLGLDIGTNSVGYAVTDGGFNLLKYKGEPMWDPMCLKKGNNVQTEECIETARRPVRSQTTKSSFDTGNFCKSY